MTLFTMIFKNLFRRKTRTFLTVLGISIGIATIVTLGAIGEGLKESLGGIITSGETDFMVTQAGISDLMFSTIEDEKLEELNAMEEINKATPVLLEVAQMEGVPYFFVLGTNKEGMELNNVALASGRYPEDNNNNEIILGKAASENLKKSEGGKINVFNNEFEVVGIYETGDIMKDGGAVVPLRRLQTLQKKEGKISLINVDAKDRVDINALTEKIEGEHKDELSTIKSIDEIGKADQGVVLIDGAVFALSVLAIIIGGIGVANTMIMSVYERTKEIGTFRAIGWKKRRIIIMILSESIVACLFAVIFGSLLGVGIVELIMLSPAVRGIFGPGYSLDIFLTASYVAIGVGLVGGAYPAYRASKMSPAEALRYE